MKIPTERRNTFILYEKEEIQKWYDDKRNSYKYYKDVKIHQSQSKFNTEEDNRQQFNKDSIKSSGVKFDESLDNGNKFNINTSSFDIDLKREKVSKGKTNALEFNDGKLEELNKVTSINRTRNKNMTFNATVVMEEDNNKNDEIVEQAEYD